MRPGAAKLAMDLVRTIKMDGSGEPGETCVALVTVLAGAIAATSDDKHTRSEVLHATVVQLERIVSGMPPLRDESYQRKMDAAVASPESTLNPKSPWRV